MRNFVHPSSNSAVFPLVSEQAGRLPFFLSGGRRGRHGIVVAAVWFAVGLCFAGPADPVGEEQTVSPTLDAFRNEQLALLRERETLDFPREVPSARLAAWLRKNAPRFAAQRDRLMQIAAEPELGPWPESNAVRNLPANISPAMREFLTAHAALADARARIHNAELEALPLEVTLDEVRQLQEREARIFAQAHGADLKVQAQRIAALAAQAVPASAVPPAAGSPIPPDASPRLRALLAERNAFLRERARLWEQTSDADPAARDQAMQAWQKQNAAHFERLRALAGTLTPKAKE